MSDQIEIINSDEGLEGELPMESELSVDENMQTFNQSKKIKALKKKKTAPRKQFRYSSNNVFKRVVMDLIRRDRSGLSDIKSINRSVFESLQEQAEKVCDAEITRILSRLADIQRLMKRKTVSAEMFELFHNE
jgi:DNA anti-recombination protein RmuC